MGYFEGFSGDFHGIINHTIVVFHGIIMGFS